MRWESNSDKKGFQRGAAYFVKKMGI